MTAQIIDGRAIAARLKDSVAREVRQRTAAGIPQRHRNGRVRDDFAAPSYERRIARIAQELGVRSQQHALQTGVIQERLIRRAAQRQPRPQRCAGPPAAASTYLRS